MTSQDGSHLKALVAANIDRGITEHELTNRALGERIAKTEHQVWRWRRGKHMPDLDTLAALARELFDGDMAQFYLDADVTSDSEAAA